MDTNYKLTKIIFYFLLVFQLIGCAQTTNPSFDYAITNVSVLNMETGNFVPEQTVFIQQGSISEITSKSLPASSTGQIIDGQGKFLIPGISEMHAHIPTPREGNDANVKETLFLYLSNGITTIRGMLGQPYHLELKEKIGKDEILSPRVFTSSPSLNGNTVTSKEVADSLVRKYKKDGYDFLKLHPGITLENFNSIVHTANEVGIQFAGHVSVGVGIRNALDAGYGSIDHLDGYLEGLVPETSEVDPASNGFFGYNFTKITDKSLLPELIKKTVEKKVWIVPTHILMQNIVSDVSAAELLNEPEMKYVSPATRVSWQSGKSRFLGDESFDENKAHLYLSLRDQILKDLYENGADILLGSDAPQVYNVPGFSIQKEMQSMVHAGIPPFKVIKSGSVNPARFFGLSNEFGKIEKGMSADLVLLAANPLEDITNMQQIEGVMVRGKWLSKDFIGKELAKIERAHNEVNE